MKNLAVIGFGQRAETLLRVYAQEHADVRIAAVFDCNEEAARQAIHRAGFDEQTVRFYSDAPSMLAQPGLDGVVIATHCLTHTDFAIQALQTGLPCLLEKPVAIDEEQLHRLSDARKRHPDTPVLVSYPLRASHICKLAKSLIDSGTIGAVQQVQAVNNVSYGRVYYKTWYRDEAQTGGLFLQKATHDLDCISYLLGSRRPVWVAAMQSKQIFKGNMPAGLCCGDCKKKYSCEESTWKLARENNPEESYGDRCSFAVDTGNHDSASVLIQYEDGMHVVYTQNFFVRKSAARRQVRLLGYEGTMEFSWTSDECTVYHHLEDRVDHIRVDNSVWGHNGGDRALCDNFLSVMDGGKPLATLEDGLMSAELCLQARISAQTREFRPISTF